MSLKFRREVFDVIELDGISWRVSEKCKYIVFANRIKH